MTWHLEEEAVRRYQSGATSTVGAASVEAHLAACAGCRQLLVVDEVWLTQSWGAVVGRFEAPQPTFVERMLVMVGVPGPTARLLAVTPSLRLSWLVAVTLVLGFAVAMAQLVEGVDALLLFGTVAPVLPVVGVALAYGRLADPSFEILAACPVDRFRLLLLRTTAVTSSTLVLSLLGGLLLPGVGLFGVWVLPALALTALTLVMSSRLEMWKAATAVVSGWAVLALLAVPSPSGYARLFGPGSQLVYAGLLMAGFAAVVVMRDSFNRGGAE